MINILKHLNLILIAILIILLPFATDSSLLFPTQTAKFFMFSFAAIFIFSLFLLQIVFIKKNKVLKISLLDILLVMFFLYISTFVLLNLEKFGLPDRFILLIGLTALYIVFRSLRIRHFKVLFIAVLLSGILQAVYGNLQLYGIFPSRHNLFNITGGFFNPGPYAGYLAIIFPLALALYFATSADKNKTNANGFKLKLFNIKVSESTVVKYISIAVIITILLVLPSTRSRAAWLAAIIPSFFILAHKYKQQKIIKSKLNSLLKKTLFVTVLVIITGVSALGLYAMKKGSSDGRLLIWKVTTNMIGQKPILGFGYNRFEANYLNFQADYLSKKGSESEALIADNSTRAFNEYLQLTAENGIIGLLLTLAIIWSCFFGKTENMETGNKPLLLAARMSLSAFAIFAVFSYPTEILPIKLVVTICLAFIASTQKSISLKKFNPSMQLGSVKLILLVVSFATLLFTLLLILPLQEKYKIHKKWKQAYSTYQIGFYEASVEAYKKIYEKLKFNSEYLVNFGKACSMAGKHKTGVDILSRAEKFMPNTIVYTALGDSYKALGKFAKAEYAYKKAAAILPAKFYPEYLLAKLYNETGQNKKAVEIANKLMHKKVKVQSTAIEEIKTAMKEIIEKNE